MICPSRSIAPFPAAPAALALFLALLGGGCGGARPNDAPPFRLTDLSPAERQTFDRAEQFHRAVAPAVISDPEVNNYLQQLGKRIVAAARADDTTGGKDWTLKGDALEFHVVRSAVPNALALGGRHVYVYNGLLQQCRTEDDLAAVMCHEFAHVRARHAQQQNYNGLGPEGLAADVVNRPYTPAQEAQADLAGLRAYAQAGWDLPGYSEFLGSKLGDGPRAAGLAKLTEQLGENPPNKARAVKGPKQFRQTRDRVKGELPRAEPGPEVLLLEAVPSCFPGAVGPAEAARQAAAVRWLRTPRVKENEEVRP